MTNKVGRFELREQELKLLIDGNQMVTLSEDGMRSMINLLPDHFFMEIFSVYQKWLDENGHDPLTEDEFDFLRKIVNRQISKMNKQKREHGQDIR